MTTPAGNAPSDPRYPIGDFVRPGAVTPAALRAWIRDIAECPARLRAAVLNLSEPQLETPYREGGWTVRQVVHHVPDSHMNAYIRTKLALTEDEPLVKGYDESTWARLADARTMPVEASLQLLEGLHGRWVAVLESLQETDFKRAFVHPELGRMTVGMQMALYSWHSRHHVAHIAGLRARKGW